MLNSGKWKKFLSIPFRYTFSFFYRHFIFSFTKLAIQTKTRIITGDVITVLFPSATDLYLFGCKSHDSELRLTKYLINHLKEGDIFIDAGAHFGYYSILAARLVGEKGKVFSFEPSGTTFKILKQNTSHISWITAFNQAVYKENTTLKFYQYPPLQSEYNTAQPINNLTDSNPIETKVEAVTIDSITINFHEAKGKIFIKIDVEGGEYNALQGMKAAMAKMNPVIVMEYFEKYPSSNYANCVSFLENLYYSAFKIDSDGNPESTKLNPQITDVIADSSDNLVFYYAN